MKQRKRIRKTRNKIVLTKSDMKMLRIYATNRAVNKRIAKELKPKMSYPSFMKRIRKIEEDELL